MNCYISRNYKDQSTSGNKAKTDMEALMEELGFRNIGLKQTQYSNPVISFLFILMGIIKAALYLNKGDVLFLQYPLKKYFYFICNIAHLKKCKVVILIHDLGSFRRKKLTVHQEIKKLNHADYIIATNPIMQQWLSSHHCKAQLGSLGIWDYLSPNHSVEQPIPMSISSPYKIVYAGALRMRKCGFLYNWGDEIQCYSVNLYGKNFSINEAKGKDHFNYMGFVQSDKLISSMQGDFGLVWDGDSITTCSGNFGEYLQYNTPHKISLYIRCGLPIIIWNKAALSTFIQDQKIGYCINSLSEINEILSSITPKSYEEMRINVLRIDKQLSQGFYFKHAIKEAIATLQQ